MRLISYKNQDAIRVGAMIGDEAVDLIAAYCAQNDKADDGSLSMMSLLQSGESGMENARRAFDYAKETGMATVPVDSLHLLPPVVRPGKAIALGRNYAAHAAEGGAEPPKFPMLFHKTATSLTGHRQPIRIPAVCTKVDYEAELTIVIGKHCRNVSEADALDYVAGYTVSNDVSARGWQRRTTQFTAGKMVDTFGPTGPALVTKDEIADVQNLEIKSWLNGQLMQHSNTKMMIFPVAFTIAYISQISTLEPGDIIMTGTPEGVGYARTPPVFMKHGDEVTIEVEGVGRLTNPVEDE